MGARAVGRPVAARIDQRARAWMLRMQRGGQNGRVLGTRVTSGARPAPKDVPHRSSLMLNPSLHRLRAHVDEFVEGSFTRADAFGERFGGLDRLRRVAAPLAVVLIPAVILITALAASGPTLPLQVRGPAPDGSLIGLSGAAPDGQAPAGSTNGGVPSAGSEGTLEPSASPGPTPGQDATRQRSGTAGSQASGGPGAGLTGSDTTAAAPFPSSFSGPFTPPEPAFSTPPPTGPTQAPAPTDAPAPSSAPTTPAPGTVTPAPTPAPTPPPPDPTPQPTPTPTPAPTPPPPDPTPQPTPTPTPTPPPADTSCTNGVDDDGDLLPDLLDPGCLLGDSEFDA